MKLGDEYEDDDKFTLADCSHAWLGNTLKKHETKKAHNIISTKVWFLLYKSGRLLLLRSE